MFVDSVLTNRFELEEWTEAVASAAGDPAAATSQLFCRWGKAQEPGEVGAEWNGRGTLMFELESGILWPVEVDADGPTLDGFGNLRAFLPKKVCPGVWALSPSFNVAGVLHAYLVIHSVPEPAPWERLVILVSA